MVSDSMTLPLLGFFSSFDRSTGSLSVIREYLALRNGLRGFSQGFTWPDLLRYLSEGCTNFVYGTVTLYGVAFQPLLLFGNFLTSTRETLQPQEENPPGLGFSAFARRYWRNRFFFLFLQVLRCFSSLCCLYRPMNSADTGSGIPGSMFVWQLPRTYRSLQRPSKSSDTKTSPMRPFLAWSQISDTPLFQPTITFGSLITTNKQLIINNQYCRFSRKPFICG